MHRDIKPENILLESRHAVVADFGIAKALTAAGGDQLTATGIAVGTAAYMSPEQGAGSGEVDGRSDLYSLGCVLYEMLSGETPYLGSTPQAILAKKLTEPAPRITLLRDTVPAAIETALSTVLARTSADRFSTAAQFVAALTPDGRPRRARRVPHWVVPAAAAVIVVLGALVVRQVLPRSGAASMNAPREPVVVVPFEVRGSHPALVDAGQRLATELTDAIAQEGLGVVAPVSVTEEVATSGTPDALRRVARASRAATLVTGTVYQRGDTVEVQARVLRAADLAPIFAMPVEQGLGEVPFAGTKRRVLGAVAYYLSAEMRGRDASLYRPPSSLESYRLAQRADQAGRRALPLSPDGGIDAASAVGYWRAFRVDTTHLGYLLFHAWWASGGDRRDSILRVVASRRGQLTRGEVLVLDYLLGRTAGPEEQYRAAMAGFAADSVWWRYFAMLAARNDNRPAEALHLYEKRDTTSVFAQNRARWDLAASDVLHQLGRFDEQLTLAQDAARRGIDNSFLGLNTAVVPLTAQIVALGGLGRTAEIDSLIALAHADPFPFAACDMMLEAGRELARHGHAEAGQRLLERGIAWANGQQYSGRDEMIRLNFLTELYYSAGHYQEAERASKLIAQRPEAAGGWDRRALLGYEGRVAARLGDTATARKDADALEAELRPWVRGDAVFDAGIIHGLLGHRERAVALLRLGLNNGARFVWSYSEPGTRDYELLEDYPPFESLVRRKDWRFR